MIIEREITYTQRVITGFNISGQPIYTEITRAEVIRACSEKELKIRILQFQNHINDINVYKCHRHPRKYVEVLP